MDNRGLRQGEKKSWLPPSKEAASILIWMAGV